MGSTPERQGGPVPWCSMMLQIVHSWHQAMKAATQAYRTNRKRQSYQLSFLKKTYGNFELRSSESQNEIVTSLCSKIKVKSLLDTGYY